MGDDPIKLDTPTSYDGYGLSHLGVRNTIKLKRSITLTMDRVSILLVTTLSTQAATSLRLSPKFLTSQPWNAFAASSS